MLLISLWPLCSCSDGALFAKRLRRHCIPDMPTPLASPLDRSLLSTQPQRALVSNMSMQAAMGATGVEGAFRRGCEHVMRVARRHSTTLSSLLQSVLLDPLVTWSPDKDQAATKKVCCTPPASCTSMLHTWHSNVEAVIVLATPTAQMQAVLYIHPSAALSLWAFSQSWQAATQLNSLVRASVNMSCRTHFVCSKAWFRHS